MEEHVLLCQDSLEGIFTAIYMSYAMKLTYDNTVIQCVKEENYRLFCVYHQIISDSDKSERVIRTLKNKFREEFYFTCCLALASQASDKASVVYRVIAKGLMLENPWEIERRYGDRDVMRLMELRRNCWNEYHHLLGFVRFRQMEQGILFSEISPGNNVLPFLAEHFADRLPMEAFAIVDVRRKQFALHEPGGEWYLAQGAEEGWNEELQDSCDEAQYQELFRHFCHKIAIKERENLNLQRQMLPLRFRKHMVEFQN